jgi:hypothetical protein
MVTDSMARSRRQINYRYITTIDLLIFSFAKMPFSLFEVRHCFILLINQSVFPFHLVTLSIKPRETREGWPLLTVETELNGDSCCVCCSGTRDFCSALAALVGPVQTISPYTISMPSSPSTSKLGRQPCWAAYLLVCVSE